jgi:GNAT superfamily N-acetyltransferase
MVEEWQRDGYTISTDPARLDLEAIHRFLTTSYWSPGLPLAVLERAVAGSLCFGIYQGATQAGFGRVVTDRATFGYLCDVFVLEPYRGRGLSKWMLECIDAHPELQGFRRWMLFTRDAQGLYRQFGYAQVAIPERCMERRDPDVYQRFAG